MVDANNYHLFQPLLHQVAIAGLDDDDVAYPTRGILRRLDRTSFRLGRVRGIDPDARRVHLADGGSLAYDQLVIAAGAVTDTFGTPGADEHAIGLENLGDAVRVRRHMATIGRRAAASEFPIGFTLRGSVGWPAWLGLHLIGFRNRINVLVNWTWNYLTDDHGSRLLELEEEPEAELAGAGGRLT